MTVRPERTGTHRSAYESNRKKILATQNTCAICGRPVDHQLKYPHPMSAAIDHIIPVSKNGHPSDISNLQLAHMSCNRQKSDKVFQHKQEPKIVGNRNLPQSMAWTKYRSDGSITTEKKRTVVRLPKKSNRGA